VIEDGGKDRLGGWGVRLRFLVSAINASHPAVVARQAGAHEWAAMRTWSVTTHSYWPLLVCAVLSERGRGVPKEEENETELLLPASLPRRSRSA
jgi:hypothetical protein